MIKIHEIDYGDAPMSILLLADPDERKISAYLDGSRAFVAAFSGGVVGVLVLKPSDAVEAEIMNIAVEPDYRRKGIGSALVRFAVDRVREMGLARLVVGTGNSSLGQLGFYQRLGFRICGFTPDYFSDYNPPIFEDGIRCIDKVYLRYLL